MKNEKKEFAVTVIIVIVFCLVLFIAGFTCGYLSFRARIYGDKIGAGADVSGYNSAAERIGNVERAIEDASGSVGEAAAEVRVSVNDAGRIGEISGDVADGIERAIDGARDVEDGIRVIVGILDVAGKRSAQVEADRGVGVD